jgi:hypothetical protein
VGTQSTPYGLRIKALDPGTQQGSEENDVGHDKAAEAYPPALLPSFSGNGIMPLL